MEWSKRPARLEVEPWSQGAAHLFENWLAEFKTYKESFSCTDDASLGILANCLSLLNFEMIADCDHYDDALRILKSAFVGPVMNGGLSLCKSQDVSTIVVDSFSNSSVDAVHESHEPTSCSDCGNVENLSDELKQVNKDFETYKPHSIINIEIANSFLRKENILESLENPAVLPFCGNMNFVETEAASLTDSEITTLASARSIRFTESQETWKSCEDFICNNVEVLRSSEGVVRGGDQYIQPYTRCERKRNIKQLNFTFTKQMDDVIIQNSASECIQYLDYDRRLVFDQSSISNRKEDHVTMKLDVCVATSEELEAKSLFASFYCCRGFKDWKLYCSYKCRTQFRNNINMFQKLVIRFKILNFDSFFKEYGSY